MYHPIEEQGEPVYVRNHPYAKIENNDFANIVLRYVGSSFAGDFPYDDSDEMGKQIIIQRQMMLEQPVRDFLMFLEKSLNAYFATFNERMDGVSESGTDSAIEIASKDAVEHAVIKRKDAESPCSTDSSELTFSDATTCDGTDDSQIVDDSAQENTGYLQPVNQVIAPPVHIKRTMKLYEYIAGFIHQYFNSQPQDHEALQVAHINATSLAAFLLNQIQKIAMDSTQDQSDAAVEHMMVQHLERFFAVLLQKETQAEKYLYMFENFVLIDMAVYLGYEEELVFALENVKEMALPKGSLTAGLWRPVVESEDYNPQDVLRAKLSARVEERLGPQVC